MEVLTMTLTGLRLASPVDGPEESAYYALDFIQTDQPTTTIPRNQFSLYVADVGGAEIGAQYDLSFAASAPVAKKKTADS